MISQQHFDNKRIFIGKKGDIDTKIYMQTNDNQSIMVIQLRNQNKMEYYQLKIDQNYLIQNTQMSFCFQTPQDLFYTLVQLFQDIKISSDGILIFEMKLNASKLKKKIFKLQIIKQDIDVNEIMKIKYEKLKKQFNIQITNKNNQIQKLNKITQQLQNKTILLEQNINQIKKQGQQLSLQYKKKDFKINSILKENDLQRQEISILRKSLEQLHRKFSILEFYHFYNNPHWHMFSVYRGQQSVIIIKKDSDNIWHNFIRNIPLLDGKNYIFRIKQLKTNYKNIMIGIATKQAFGVTSAYKSNHTISYNSYSGNIWQKGSSRKAGTSLFDGQIITVQINLLDYKLIWSIQGKKVGQSIISNEFKNKQLYLCLQFYNIQDELQLMLY